MNMINLPLQLEGSSLLAQIKRKDKLSQTKYSHVNNGTVKWEQENMSFSTALWINKDGSFEEKCFTIKIKSLESEKDIMEFELDLSKFVKENSFLEHNHGIVLGSLDDDSDITYANNQRGSSNQPRLNLVIRSYAEGVNHQRGGDFSQFHDTNAGNFTNPLHSTMSVVINEPIDTIPKRYGDNDDDGLMPDPDDRRMKERRGTRKISVMFNEVTENGHRQSCLPSDRYNNNNNNNNNHDDKAKQRASTYRFSIAAGKDIKAPQDSDSDDMDLTPQRNVFDDEDDPFEGLDGKKTSNRQNRLMSTVGTRHNNHFDIGEDDDYD